jgi:peroxiredoxin
MSPANFFRIGMLSLLLSQISNAADSVGDFSLPDQNGDTHRMSFYDDHVAIALLVQANGDRTVAGSMSAYNALKARFDRQGFEFLMINPMGLNNSDAVQQEVLGYGVDIPVLMDNAQSISKALNITTVGEVFLFDPKTFTVKYRGPVGAGLEQAIYDLLSGGRVSKPVVAIDGAPVLYEERN